MGEAAEQAEGGGVGGVGVQGFGGGLECAEFEEHLHFAVPAPRQRIRLRPLHDYVLLPNPIDLVSYRDLDRWENRSGDR